MKLVLKFLLLIGSLLICKSSLSVPSAPLGISIGSNTPVLHIEGFYDLLGSTSSESFYVLYQVLQNFNINNNPGLRFTFYVWPQNVFTFSYLVSTAAEYLKNNYQQEADLWTFYGLMFNNYQNFSNAATYNSSLNQVKTQLATLISQNMKQYNFQDILNGLNNEANQSGAEFVSQYGRSRGVVSAPLYFANGILLNAGDELTTSTWTSFISQYVNATHVIRS